MVDQTRFRRFGAGFLFLVGGLMLAGCGGRSLGTVSGKVSYKGQPVKGGTVAIIPKAGGVLQGPIQEDGSFSIDKVPTGPATITVETASVRPSGAKSAMPGPYSKIPQDVTRGFALAEKTGDPNRYVPIPERYGSHESSGLSMDVKSGPQTHDLDLQ